MGEQRMGEQRMGEQRMGEQRMGEQRMGEQRMGEPHTLQGRLRDFLVVNDGFSWLAVFVCRIVERPIVGTIDYLHGLSL